MNWSDVTNFIGGAAPVVGGLLAGKAGEAVGTIVAKALGVEDKPDAVIDALKNSPDAIIKIKELENSKAIADMANQLDNKKADYAHDEAYLTDVSNARQMQMTALNQEDIFSKRYVYYLATAWSVFAFLYIASVTFATIPAANVRIVDTVLGVLLGTIIGTIMNYFFGSSLGSKTKTDILQRSNQNKEV
jgi:outer membrane lipoprotein SlyB